MRTLLLVSLALLGCNSDAPSDPDGSLRDAEALADAGALSDADTPIPSDGATPDAGPPLPPLPPPVLGEPLEVSRDRLGEWVWIALPEMRCSDGTEGGFAVSFTDASRDLLIYFQGGGICYDALTCAVGGAASSVGDDPLRTALDGSIRGHRGVFDRDDSDNPFRDSNFVVLPHCTGDHHTGSRVSTYRDRTFHHVGYTNVTRMLERVVPTFADADRVVLSGFSAGGVGIAANYHQLASAFESVGRPPPFLVVDAGPFMRPPTLRESAQSALRESWGLDRTIGTFCPSCLTTGFHDIYRINADLHAGMRASLVCSYEDSVVRVLYGVLNQSPLDGSQMRAGLHDLADWSTEIAPTILPSRFEVFYFGGERHGALNVDALSATPGLASFLAAQLGAGSWESVRP